MRGTWNVSWWRVCRRWSASLVYNGGAGFCRSTCRQSIHLSLLMGVSFDHSGNIVPWNTNTETIVRAGRSKNLEPKTLTVSHLDQVAGIKRQKSLAKPKSFAKPYHCGEAMTPLPSLETTTLGCTMVGSTAMVRLAWPYQKTCFWPPIPPDPLVISPSH